MFLKLRHLIPFLADEEKNYHIIRLIFGVLVLIGLVVSLLVIFILTEQTPEETTHLSSFATYAISDLLSIAGIFLQSDDLPLLSKLLRRLAHTVEFFVVGFFVAVTVLLWLKERVGLAKSRNYALGICIGLSLFDQTHKLFVIGREFDVIDLIFDAAGYLSALFLVLAIYKAKESRKARINESSSE